MITGEDYNISPLSASTQISKIKAVNRTSSGISRYFDLSDPTGKSSSTTLFADDGILYTEEYTNSMRFSYQNKTDIEGVIYNNIFDILKDNNLRNFYYSQYINFVTASLDILWRNVTLDSNASTGSVVSADGNTVYKVGSFTATDLKYFKAGPIRKLSSVSLEDLYMAILWPVAVGKSNDYVLFSSPSKAYEQNKGLDKNKDGNITKAEAAAKARDQLNYIRTQLLKIPDEGGVWTDSSGNPITTGDGTPVRYGPYPPN
jgi:hypothetical protein